MIYDFICLGLYLRVKPARDFVQNIVRPFDAGGWTKAGGGDRVSRLHKRPLMGKMSASTVDVIAGIAVTDDLRRRLLVDNPMRLYWPDEC